MPQPRSAIRPHAHNANARSFFRFPELLLLITMLVAPAIMIFQVTDEVLHSGIWIIPTPLGNDLVLKMDALLLFSWLSHILVRTRSSLSAAWRWAHVALSSVLTLLVPILQLLYFREIRAKAFADIIEQSKHAFWIFDMMYDGMRIFLLLQLAFWVTVAVAIFRRK